MLSGQADSPYKRGANSPYERGWNKGWGCGVADVASDRAAVEPFGQPDTVVIKIRRYLCRRCEAVVQVVPRKPGLKGRSNEPAREPSGLLGELVSEGGGGELRSGEA